MPRLFLQHIDNQPAVTDGAGVRSQPVFDRGEHPLHLHVKTLEPKAKLEWESAPAPRLGFVWEGSVSVGKMRLPANSVFAIEKGSRGAAVATEEGARLLLFGGGDNRPDNERAGGNVHVLLAQDVPSTPNFHSEGEVGATLWADAGCPGCTLWLHGNSFRPGFLVQPHHHNQDEIIVVTDGTIRIGSKSYGRGTALQVSKFADYTFTSGHDGLSYIVFHPGAPNYVSVGRNVTLEEQAIYQRACGKPQPIRVL